MNTETSILIIIFAILYIGYILRKTMAHRLDIFDFLMLSMVAVIPVFFVIFPSLWNFISDKVGVTFPFLLLFGFLLAVIFLLVHQLYIQAHRFEARITTLSQEVALLKEKNDSNSNA